MTARTAANARPFLAGGEAEGLLRVLHSGQYGHGEETERFERDLAAHLGVRDVVAVASGTAALQIALLAAGLGPGCEVVAPSFTFCASIQAIIACGAVPRFAEVDPATMCTGPAEIAEALTPATRAVMPVLYGGRAVDLSALNSDLAARRITVVEDAAHAFGSRQGSHMVGATGALTCFSFDPIKNLTCGEGGALVPQDPTQAARARQIRGLGITETPARRRCSPSYTVAGPGLRAHLPALNAAIGRAQLAGFAEASARRTRLWLAYQEALAGASGLTLVDLDIAHTVPFNCAVRIHHGRDDVFAAMRARGIGIGVHYPPNHLQPAFASWRRPLPRTELAARQVLSLPFHPAMTGADARHVAAALSEALR